MYIFEEDTFTFLNIILIELCPFEYQLSRITALDNMSGIQRRGLRLSPSEPLITRILLILLWFFDFFGGNFWCRSRKSNILLNRDIFIYILYCQKINIAKKASGTYSIFLRKFYGNSSLGSSS